MQTEQTYSLADNKLNHGKFPFDIAARHIYPPLLTYIVSINSLTSPSTKP